MSPVFQATIARGTPGPRPKMARGIYSFADDGGVVGTIALMGAVTGVIPAGATVWGGWVEVTEALTSGGAATAAIQVEAAGDIVPAQTLGTWTTGRKRIIPAAASSTVLAAATDVRTTLDRDVSLVIGAFDLTAGAFSVVLFYTDPLA